MIKYKQATMKPESGLFPIGDVIDWMVMISFNSFIDLAMVDILGGSMEEYEYEET